ncbi:MAG: hypothetical protein ABJH04_07805 [Cyclobacteriaceae bacterium]
MSTNSIQLSLFLQPAQGVKAIQTPITSRTFTAEESAYINGPKVSQGSGWLSSLPTWMNLALETERTQQVLSGNGELKACRLDVLIFLYESALMGPLTNEYANIYFVLARELCTRYLRQNGPWPLEVRELSSWEDRLLVGMQIDLRKRIAKAYKAKWKNIA